MTKGITATAAASGSVFNSIDWLVVVLFIASMVAVVMFAMRKKATSGKDYFLSSRDSNSNLSAPLIRLPFQPGIRSAV